MIKRLKELRMEKGLTQNALAQKLNMTQQTYSDYETGKTNPNVETLIALADILECSIDYLVGRADDFGSISFKDSSATFSLEETQLLRSFRRLSKNEKTQANEYLQFLSQRYGK